MITHVQAMRRALSETFPNEDVFKAFTDQQVIDSMVLVSPRTWPALADDLDARGGGEEGSGAPVGHFAAHERLRCSRPVTICAP